MKRIAMAATSLVTVGVLVAVLTGVSAAASEPMADAGLDQTVTVGTAVQLDGTGSTHPDGTITGYEWTVRSPDGREIETTCGNCSRSQFTPTSVGRHVVNLTVTGSDGVQRSDTLYVYVQNAGPEVEISGPRTPDPDAPATYTATAESPDAELAEIAWAVQDEIVTVRPLDGTTDESSLSLAFTASQTYRVQVVVRDTNGRTAYDQLIVQPGSNDIGDVSGWEDVESASCDDSEYRSSNPEECAPDETPEPAEDSPDDTPTPETELIYYETSGYDSTAVAGASVKDSSYVGKRYYETGLDDGEMAPWNVGGLKKMGRKATSAFLGQEKKTVNCTMVGGQPLRSDCEDKVEELERNGETSNVNSPSTSGLFSEYGLKDAERISGNDPTNLEEGQKANITVEIQPAKEGIVPKITSGANAAFDRAEDTFTDVIDEEGSSQASSSSSPSTEGDGETSSTSSDSDGETRGIVDDSNDDQSSSDEPSLPPTKTGVGIVP